MVAVDVAGIQLFGENNGVPQYTRHIDFCIDHHAGNSGYADFTLMDGQAAAAAELLYEVIMAMKVPMTAHIANCLYTGLSTDTGCFRFFLHHGKDPSGGGKAHRGRGPGGRAEHPAVRYQAP